MILRSILVAAGVLVATEARAFDDSKGWDDPSVMRLIGAGVLEGEGAPPKASAGRLVFLTALGDSADWGEVVNILAAARQPEGIVRFSWDRLDGAFEKLRRVEPEFVIVFSRPEDLDVNRHFEFLERASQLDSDPFVDFSFGYVTAASPTEGLAFSRNVVRAAGKAYPKRILEFGPGQANEFTGFGADRLAKDFKSARLSHKSPEWAFEKHADDFSGCGILKAWGHGMPDGVSDGLKTSHVRSARLDLLPSLYFSGPCYCGVTGRWFEPDGGAVAAREVKPLDSFALALIARGATAVFAGLDPDRGETNEQELETLLTSGCPLGEAVKSTYDDVALGYRREPFALGRYEPGKSRPDSRILDTMLLGGACRVLLGDPTVRPYKKAMEPAWRTSVASTKTALIVTAEANEPVTQRWYAVNVFHSDGGWTHQVRITIELEPEQAKGLRALKDVSFLRDGKSLATIYSTAGIERFLGKTRLHLLTVFPTDPKNRALFQGHRFQAKFTLERLS